MKQAKKREESFLREHHHLTGDDLGYSCPLTNASKHKCISPVYTMKTNPGSTGVQPTSIKIMCSVNATNPG